MDASNATSLVRFVTNTAADNNDLPVELPELVPGVYFAKLEQGCVATYERMVVQ